jgi:lysophospholipase L1-like esterase
MEGWKDWKSDMRSLRSECGIGSTMNVAISGSVAQHWLDLANEVAVYNPKVALYWIGTNDLMNPSKTPAQYCKTVEDTLVKLKKLLPEFRCVLLNCCRCEKRSSVEDKIAAYNKCYEELAEKYDWIILVDTEYMFCNSAGKPLASWFMDGLHPNADAFKKKVIPAIKEAILAADGKES